MEDQSFLKQLAVFEEKFQALKPELELTVRDPALDVEGFVVVWSTLASVGGPLGRCGKGGTRITPNVTLAEVSMLSRLMTLKIAAAGLPLGGAKSGLRADPDAPGFERQYRRFVELVKPTLIENGGIFGGFGFDIGARPILPHWACEVTGSTKCFTGKPLEMGGTDYDREGIAGLGVAVAAKTLLEINGEKVQDARFSVQGIGAMGAAVIRYFSEYGGKLIGLADPRVGGAYIFSNGAEPELIERISAGDIEGTKNFILKTKNVQVVEDILTQKADVLFPCALQDVISAANVDNLQTRYLVEGANNPCSPEAHAKLYKNGVHVVPDFIANPGGIIAAFIEMTSNVSIEENIAKRTKVNEAKSFTTERVSANVKLMHSLVQRHGVEPALAGKFLAFSNIFGKHGLA